MRRSWERGRDAPSASARFTRTKWFGKWFIACIPRSIMISFPPDTVCIKLTSL